MISDILNEDEIKLIERVAKVNVSRNEEPPSDSIYLISRNGHDFFINGIGPDKERIQKRLREVEEGIEWCEEHLMNQSFIDNAPPMIVESRRERLKQLRKEKMELEKGKI